MIVYKSCLYQLQRLRCRTSTSMSNVGCLSTQGRGGAGQGNQRQPVSVVAVSGRGVGGEWLSPHVTSPSSSRYRCFVGETHFHHYWCATLSLSHRNLGPFPRLSFPIQLAHHNTPSLANWQASYLNDRVLCWQYPSSLTDWRAVRFA